MSGPLETEEGRHMALWHYPLAPPWVPMPQVYLPHPFYAPMVSEYTGQVGIDNRFVNPELGYGFQNLPAARGYRAEDDPCSERDLVTGECKDTPEYKEKNAKGILFITLTLIGGLGALAVMSGFNPVKYIKKKFRKKRRN